MEDAPIEKNCQNKVMVTQQEGTQHSSEDDKENVLSAPEDNSKVQRRTLAQLLQRKQR